MKQICKFCKKEFEEKHKKLFCGTPCKDKYNYSSIFNEEEKQLTYLGRLGDATIYKQTSKYHNLRYSSIHESYMNFKKNFFINISTSNVTPSNNSGFKKSKIFQLTTGSHPFISKVSNMALDDVINSLNTFGLMLWFYDDGSYHHKKHFYNLNTHALDYDIQHEVLIPKLKSLLDVNPTIGYDKKADGRIFTYLRINKISGNASNINNLLAATPLKCFNYKR